MLEGIISRKDRTFEGTTRQEMSHSSGLEWRRGRLRGHAGTLNPARYDCQTAKHHFRTMQKNKFSQVVQIDWKTTQTTVSACKKTAARAKPWKVGDNIAKGPRETHTVTPQQGQANFGNQWYVVQTAAGGPNTIPTRHWPSRKFVSARTTVTWKDICLLLRTRSRIFRSDWERWNNNTHF